MKIAILCSGLLHDYQIEDTKWIEDNIKRVYNIFSREDDEVDVFIGTWSNPNTINLPFIDVFFDEPDIHYNSGYVSGCIQAALKNLRTCKNNNEPYDLNDLANVSSMGRRRYKENIKQHLGYIFLFKQFVENKDYDIVVRIRFDTYIDLTHPTISPSQINDTLRDLATFSFDYNKPIGFNTIDLEYEIHPFGWNKYHYDGYSLSDWMIYHPPKLLNTEYALKLFENKLLRNGETGWYDILCRKWDLPVEYICWNGGVLLKDNHPHNAHRTFGPAKTK